MNENHINEIINIFNSVGIWNSGKFAEKVREYCENNELDVDLVNSKLKIAFRDYLATDINPESAIRLRLSNPLPTNVAL